MCISFQFEAKTLYVVIVDKSQRDVIILIKFSTKVNSRKNSLHFVKYLGGRRP